ncbi:MAG: pilus assembly PilX family protein [Pseudoalteromonas prydzensis]|uniref:pilus assembly PilX family protein n=1 Tax=Pseudoalteromonas prydzensis TaxID=182141 RepID=UPI003F947FA2
MAKKQCGFTLVTVLILTSMASIVVLNSLRENIVQERMSGNFQKKMNSRLLAEKGVFEEAKLLQQALLDDKSLDIDGLIAATGNISGIGLIGDDATYNASIAKNAAGELEISSIGERYNGDAQSNLVARFGFTPGKGGSVFENAIVGCEGVSLSASGRIDSYDSSKGDYDPDKAEAGAVIGTVYKDKDVTLSGASTIWGSVHATGSITFSGSSPITGTLRANNHITIDSNFTVSTDPVLPDGFPLDTAVGGDVLSAGGVTWKQGKILGVVRANKDLNFPNNSASTVLENRNNDGLDVLYGGKLNAKDLAPHLEQGGIPYSDPRYNVSPNVELVPFQDPDNFTAGQTQCDSINITTVVDGLVDPSAENIIVKHGSSTLVSDKPETRVIYELTPEIAQSKIENQGDYVWEKWLGARPATLNYTLNTIENVVDVKVLKAGNFSLNNGILKVAGGDVTLIVNGHFMMEGASEIHIAQGSSLSLYVNGKVKLKASPGSITMKHGLTKTGKPVFSIYSSNEQANGIDIDADANLYAAIYAPKTDVKVVANGGFSGSIRGKTVSASGKGGIHHDSNLANISSGGGSASDGKLVFLGWSYKVPEKTTEGPEEDPPEATL